MSRCMDYMGFQVGDILFWDNRYWTVHGYSLWYTCSVWKGNQWIGQIFPAEAWSRARKVEKLEALVVLGIKI